MIATSNVKIDGVMYHKGDTIPEFGSIECISSEGMQRNYQCLKADVDKLPHYVEGGSTCFVVDSGELYIYHKQSDTWYLQ